MKKNVCARPLFFKGAIKVIGFALVGFIQIPGIELVSSALAQTTAQNGKASKAPQVKQKAAIPSSKQVGLKVKQNTFNQSSKSMSLNPELFKRIEGEYSSEGAANLDYRVQRGCLRRSYNEDHLPSNLGLSDRNFNDFFKSQTKGFFDRMRGNCIPYALALGSRNRFESLSIMNGPIQDAKTEIWTFTPSAAGSFLIQQDYLKDESKRFTEIQLPLRDVLYDPKK